MKISLYLWDVLEPLSLGWPFSIGHRCPDGGKPGPWNPLGSRDWANNNIYFILEYETLETNVENELIYNRFQGRSAETQISNLLGFAWITNNLDLSCYTPHFLPFGNVNIKKKWSRKLRRIILLQIGLVTFKFHFRKASKTRVYVVPPKIASLIFFG